MQCLTKSPANLEGDPARALMDGSKLLERQSLHQNWLVLEHYAMEGQSLRSCREREMIKNYTPRTQKRPVCQSLSSYQLTIGMPPLSVLPVYFGGSLDALSGSATLSCFILSGLMLLLAALEVRGQATSEIPYLSTAL